MDLHVEQDWIDNNTQSIQDLAPAKLLWSIYHTIGPCISRLNPSFIQHNFAGIHTRDLAVMHNQYQHLQTFLLKCYTEYTRLNISFLAHNSDQAQQHSADLAALIFVIWKALDTHLYNPSIFIKGIKHPDQEFYTMFYQVLEETFNTLAGIKHIYSIWLAVNIR